MASTGSGSGSVPVNFFLTPQQQNLLFAALDSNKQQLPTSRSDFSLSSNSFRSAPLHNVDHTGFHESPLLNHYDYDFGDSNFDFPLAADASQANLSGDLAADGSASLKSESTENETSEKRSHPDDEEDDESPGNESKRHEAGEKVPKKPGRKPLTSEPTSKRKAQNRAAQRAFRERKEKHLKDLETKVEELEKASETANHENTVLRAQVERITTELNHYKQQMTLLSSKPAFQTKAQAFNTAAFNNINDVSFQFEFPKFGTLPGPPPVAKPQRSSSQPISPQSQQTQQVPSPAASVRNEHKSQSFDNAKSHEGHPQSSGPYTPSMGTSTSGASRAGGDSVNASLNGFMSSPSASSHSNPGPSSSCGTSPEAYTQSPLGTKPVDTLTTIGEEHPSLSSIEHPFAQFSHSYLPNNNTNFDWFVQQNGGQFDPQLFGDYREPHENVLANPTFDDLFNEPLDTDFMMPYNMAPSPAMTTTTTTRKTNLIEDIEAQQTAIEEDAAVEHSENITCHQLWDKLSNCPKAQNGDFDLDGLCSELTKKAKCSGNGPVVAERDFDTILRKYMGKDFPPEGIDMTDMKATRADLHHGL